MSIDPIKSDIKPVTYIALHGWGADHRTFDPLKPLVPENASVILPDLPGYGQSDPPKEWTIDCVTEETAEIINITDIPRPIVIVGNCLGAVLGLEMLVRKMLIADRIVIIDPVIFFPMYLRCLLYTSDAADE